MAAGGSPAVSGTSVQLLRDIEPLHVIVHVDDVEAVSAMMQLASATLARHWNRRKDHEGSFWEHPYSGERSRYNILALDRLLRRLDIPSLDRFQDVYGGGLQEIVERRALAREAVWTESLAVGDRVFVERAAQDAGNRRKFAYEPVAEGDVWAVKEEADAYALVSARIDLLASCVARFLS